MASNARVLDDVALPQERVQRNDVLIAAVEGGLLAGAAMLAWIMIAAGAEDIPLSRPLQLAAATFFGADALEGGAGMIVAGALLWAAVSVALAVVFAWIVPRDFPFSAAAIMGVGYAFFIIVMMTGMALPSLNPLMQEKMPEMGGAWVLAYFVFGVVLGVVPRLRRSSAARR